MWRWVSVGRCQWTVQRQARPLRTNCAVWLTTNQHPAISVVTQKQQTNCTAVPANLWPMTQIFNTWRVRLWPMHMQKIHVKGLYVQKLEWKQSDGHAWIYHSSLTQSVITRERAYSRLFLNIKTDCPLNQMKQMAKLQSVAMHMWWVCSDWNVIPMTLLEVEYTMETNGNRNRNC